jgi:hypothetical protein
LTDARTFINRPWSSAKPTRRLPASTNRFDR